MEDTVGVFMLEGLGVIGDRDKGMQVVFDQFLMKHCFLNSF